MEQFKCPICGRLQESLQIEMEVIGGESIMMPNETAEEMVDNASIGIEAHCEFCRHSGNPDDFIVIDELTEEEKNELNSRPVDGQTVLRFENEFK